MYSIVLATVMTAGAETPNWGWCRGWGCHGCHSCGWCGCRGFSGCHCGGWCGCGCWCGCSCGCWGGYSYCGGWCGCSCAISYCGCVSYGGASAQPTGDPRLSPQSDSEREAVRKVLEYMRTKKPGTSAAPSGADVAHITVRLPAQAKLYIDETLCPLTSDTRTFDTPRLEAGRKYYYTMRVELDRNGERVGETRRVMVAAGERVDVTFNPVAASASARR
jgi:uncharacterized protein (TIGR03000 family)